MSVYRKVRGHMIKRKPKGITARLRAAKRRRIDRAELIEMQKVRTRDEICRFPACGCHTRFGVNFRAEVSHQTHRGMGGDPTGDRTQAAVMVLLCNWRHKLSKCSVDRGWLRWEALTDIGANGPIRWWVRADVVPRGIVTSNELVRFESGGFWLLLAEEDAPRVWRQFTPAQVAVLNYLSQMID